ncbi:COG4223 family protein, partial [Phenylobacterium sp.]|uniref:COG4223 family protein n=1 Tax=Phenylobacterium sp. TaxID=1871053 RepID=UPI0038621D92
RAAQAAAGALAAAALMEAAQTSRPFSDELAALTAVAPPSADLRSLKSYAEQGAPSRAALAAGFPDYAARAAAAARSPQEDAGLLVRIGHALSRVVTVRRVGDVPGTGVDATLAKAEIQVEEGDIVAALATLDRLPAAGKTALAPWRARAERRADIDRRIAQVRTLALEDLAGLARSGG